MNRKSLVTIAKSALSRWQKENASLRAAALAFFIALPLPSLLLLIDELFIFIYGPEQGTQNLSQLIGAFAGPTIQSLMNQLIQSTPNPFTSIFALSVSIIFTLGGAIGAFLVLQDTLDTIWGVKSDKKLSWRVRIKDRLVPFLYVLGAATAVAVGVGLTVFLFGPVESAATPAIGSLAASIVRFIVEMVLSFSTATLLFAIIFKEVPDTQIKWRDVAVAAVITGIAFTVLNNVFGLYLRSFPVTSVAGAAGALILLLLWLFVIGEILLYGAHFSKCYAEERGSHSRIHEATEREPSSERLNFTKLKEQIKSASTKIQSILMQKAKTSKPKTATERQKAASAQQPQTQPSHPTQPTPTEITKQLTTSRPENAHQTITPNEPTKIEQTKPIIQRKKANTVQREELDSLYHAVKKEQEDQQIAIAQRNEKIIFELQKKKENKDNSQKTT